ncbi:MAG: P-loop NTPase [Phycisphaeraceae bacterium]|nr:P-loop NTPase [Phycisphaeraceae bacterium]
MHPQTAHALTPDDQAARLRLLVSALREKDRAYSHAPPVVHAQLARPKAMVVTVASGKGGVGKSCLAVCLAAAFARLGHRATLVDADLGMANADVLCGVLPRRRLDQALLSAEMPDLTDLAVETAWGFTLVPGAAASAEAATLDPAGRHKLLASLASLDAISDVLVVDTSAGIGPDVLQLVQFADAAAVVATPEPTSIADAYALLKVLAGAPVPEHAASTRRLGLVLNQACDEAEAIRVHGRIAATADRFLGWRVPLFGWIPLANTVRQAVRGRRVPALACGPITDAQTDVSQEVHSVSARLMTLARVLALPLSPA